MHLHHFAFAYLHDMQRSRPALVHDDFDAPPESSGLAHELQKPKERIGGGFVGEGHAALSFFPAFSSLIGTAAPSFTMSPSPTPCL